jgi:phosphoglycerate dehydrogenase-like enzyme
MEDRENAIAPSDSEEGRGIPQVAVIDVLPPASRRIIDARFGQRFAVVYAETPTIAHRADIVREATALLVGWSALPAQVIEAARHCKVIQKLGVGVDKIDLEAARRRGITVLRAAGINATAVAEMTLLLMLAVLRRLHWAVGEYQAGRFQKEYLRTSTFQLAGKTVGLVGMGHIGRAVARRLRSFEAKAIYYDIRRLGREEEERLGVTYSPLDDLVSESDIISLHVPSTPETRAMVNARLFARMKRGVILINTARGAIIDEAALVDALRQGIVGGAGLDVTAEEPLPPGSPLRAFGNVLITPHMAGAVADNFPRVVDHAYANVCRVLAGEPVSAEDVVVSPDSMRRRLHDDSLGVRRPQ